MCPIEQLRAACAEVERACDWLTDPASDALDSCSLVLENATSRLATMRPALHEAAGEPAALAEAWRLRRSIRRAGVLLAAAATYHQQWQSVLGSMAGGYDREGRPGDRPRSGRLCLRG
jgi:hypothetical protein